MCKNLADRLNAIRKEQGLSITAFSEELGIARSTLLSLLNGTGNPRADTIEAIADQLGTDPVWLLSARQDLPFSAPLSPQQQAQMQILLEHLKEILGENYE